MATSTMQLPPSPIAVQGLDKIPVEGERRHGNREHRALIQTSLDGFWIIDFSGRILDVNEALCQMLGYSREELLRMSIPDIEVAEVPEETAAHIQKIIRAGSDRFQTRHRRKDGAVIDVEVSAQYVAELGEHFFAFLRDITERKRAGEQLLALQAETQRLLDAARQSNQLLLSVIEDQKMAQEALAASQARLQLEISRMPIGYIVWDTDFRVVTWNPAAEKIFGFTADEARGRHPYELIVPKAAQPHVDAIWRRLCAGDETADSVNENTTKDGRTILCSWTNTPLKQSDGTVLGVLSMVQDITERKQKETEIRMMAHRLSEAERVGKLGFLDWNLITNEIEVSDETIRIYGLAPGKNKLAPEEITQRVHPDDVGYAVKSLHDAIEKGTRHDIEHRIVRTDGTVVYVHTPAEVVRDANGKPMSVLGTVQDITERKGAEEALRTTRDYLENLVIHANAPIIVWDPSYRITLFNHAFEHLSGRDANEVIGKQIAILFPADRKDEALAHIHQTKTGERWETVEIPILHSNGEVRTALWNSATLYAADGKSVVATMAQGQDITGRILAEQSLAESEERFRNATETARDAFVIIEGEGATIREWNHAAEALFGYSKEEAIGRGLHEFLPPPRFREAAQRGMEHFATTGEGAAIGKTLELAALRKDGTEFPIELSLSAMQIHGKWHATGIVRDITERKQQEAKIINLNRALRTLSACNLALVHAQTEEELFQNVCRHIIEAGGYRMAFIGFAGNDAEKTVSIAAQHGAEAGYLESLGFTWADTDKGQGTVGRAIRSGAPQVSQNIMTDPKLAAWRVVAARLGSRASISLPLKGGDGKAFGVITIGAAETDAFGAGEIELLTELADDIVFGIATLRTRAERDRIAYAHVHHAEILQKSLEQSIQAIAGTVEARDPYTAGHQRRVGELAVAIARELGLPEETIHGIQLAATIHDLGKVHIPAEILTKPGKLSDIEFMLMKTHPQAGYDILKDVDFPWPIADIVRQHHERLDGSGYPQGLKGGEILFEARIMTVADVVEAMASHRPYRPSLGLEAALAEITKQRGIYFDPQVVDACLALFREGRFAFQG